MVHLYLLEYQFLQMKNMYLGINFCKMKYSLKMCGSSCTRGIKQFTLEYIYCLSKTQTKKFFYYIY